MGMDSGEYPELPSVDGIRSYKINQGVLKSMINQTMFAISDNDSRPVYTGSLFEVEAGTLAMVSVDGYRLAIRREHIEGPEEHNEFYRARHGAFRISSASAQATRRRIRTYSSAQTTSRSPSAAP